MSTTDALEQTTHSAYNISTLALLFNVTNVFSNTIVHESISSDKSLTLTHKTKITTANVWNATLHVSAWSTQSNSKVSLTQSVKKYTPLIKNSTKSMPGMTRFTSIDTFQSRNSPSPHDINQSKTLTDLDFNQSTTLTDLVTAAIHPKNTIVSGNTESLGTKHNQLLYIFCVPFLLLACFFIYLIRRHFIRRRKHKHVTHHVSDSENEDEVMFEMTSK